MSNKNNKQPTINELYKTIPYFPPIAVIGASNILNGSSTILTIRIGIKIIILNISAKNNNISVIILPPFGLFALTSVTVFPNNAFFTTRR